MLDLTARNDILAHAAREGFAAGRIGDCIVELLQRRLRQHAAEAKMR